MVTIDLAISLSIGGILGFIVREIIGDRLARSRNLDAVHINEFNRAATKLREALLPVYIPLDPSKFAINLDLVGFLNSTFDNLRIAVLEFSNFLDTKTKTAFLEAWYEYYCLEDERNENGIRFFEQYSCRGLSIKEEHEMKKLVRNRIEKILEFAKPK